MTFIKHLLVLGAFMSAASLVQAKDVNLDEAVKLRDAGTIQDFAKLNDIAIAKHPGATIEGTELENQWGRYVYELELRDPQGVEWDMKLDAATGEVLKDHQDD